MSPLRNCGIPVLIRQLALAVTLRCYIVYIYILGIMKDISVKPRPNPINCNSSRNRSTTHTSLTSKRWQVHQECRHTYQVEVSTKVHSDESGPEYIVRLWMHRTHSKNVLLAVKMPIRAIESAHSGMWCLAGYPQRVSRSADPVGYVHVSLKKKGRKKRKEKKRNTYSIVCTRCTSLKERVSSQLNTYSVLPHFYIRTRESQQVITGYLYIQNLSFQETNPLFPRAQRPSNPIRELLTGVDQVRVLESREPRYSPLASSPLLGITWNYLGLEKSFITLLPSPRSPNPQIKNL